MHDREMDTKIAEWLGWVWLHYTGPEESSTTLVSAVDIKFFDDWYEVVDEPIGYANVSFVPFFSTDRNAMADVLKVAGERGLLYLYADALMDILGHDEFIESPESYTVVEIALALGDVATATAVQQAEALVVIIDKEKE